MLRGLHRGVRVGCYDVGDGGRREACSTYQQRNHVSAWLDALDGLAVRHVVGVEAVYFEDLVADLEAGVERGGALLRELEYE